MLYLNWDWLHQQTVRSLCLAELLHHRAEMSLQNISSCESFVTVVYQCCGNILVCKLEGSRISKYHRRNNRKFYRRHYFRVREDFFGKPLPGQEISVSYFLSLLLSLNIVCIRQLAHSGVTSFLYIRWIIKTKCKLLQKSLSRYSGSYLPSAPSPSAIFVTKHIPWGATFYCSVARSPNQANRRIGGNPNETYEIEAICILQIA